MLIIGLIMQYNIDEVPVTSEVQTVQHPTTSSCNSGCGYGGNYGVNYGCCNPRIGYW